MNDRGSLSLLPKSLTIRLIPVLDEASDAPKSAESTPAVVAESGPDSDSAALDALLDALAPHGVPEAASLVAPPVQAGGKAGVRVYRVVMSRHSESVRASLRLHGTTIEIPKAGCFAVRARIEETIGELKPSKGLRIQFPDAASAGESRKTMGEIASAIRRRFSCCGAAPTVQLLLRGPPSAHLATFESLEPASRALEDFLERGWILSGMTKHVAEARYHHPGTLEKETPIALVSAVASLPEQEKKRSREPPAPASRARAGGEEEDELLMRMMTREVKRTKDEPRSPSPSDAALLHDSQLFVVHSKQLVPAELVALFASRPGYVHMDVKLNQKDLKGNKPEKGLRGLSYVAFKTPGEARDAMEDLHDLEFPVGSGHLLKVMLAAPTPPGPRGGSPTNLGGAKPASPGSSPGLGFTHRPPLKDPGETRSKRVRPRVAPTSSPLARVPYVIHHPAAPRGPASPAAYYPPPPAYGWEPSYGVPAWGHEYPPTGNYVVMGYEHPPPAHHHHHHHPGVAYRPVYYPPPAYYPPPPAGPRPTTDELAETFETVMGRVSGSSPSSGDRLLTGGNLAETSASRVAVAASSREQRTTPVVASEGPAAGAGPAAPRGPQQPSEKRVHVSEEASTPRSSKEDEEEASTPRPSKEDEEEDPDSLKTENVSSDGEEVEDTEDEAGAPAAGAEPPAPLAERWGEEEEGASEDNTQ